MSISTNILYMCIVFPRVKARVSISSRTLFDLVFNSARGSLKLGFYVMFQQRGSLKLGYADYQL